MLSYVALSVFFWCCESVVVGNESRSSNWAVLIAGSNGYYNYRHQADIAHAYQILRQEGGFPDDKVITMIFDDVAHSPENPFPGTLFNEPNGIDYYQGMRIDYRGDKVTAETFLAVLTGDAETAQGPVLKSSSEDHVFVYYTDHGATGLVGMPSGDPLYADQLIGALQTMQEKGMYAQLVFYLEACESGSMFDGLLPNDTNVFATTAATPYQSSYAYYYNETLNTYMADEYSVRWMQDSENNWNGPIHESLILQYQDVAEMVKQSQPQQYGDVTFDEESIEEFQGYEERPTRHLDGYPSNAHADSESDSESSWQLVDARDVKLRTLSLRLASAESSREAREIERLIQEEVKSRQDADAFFRLLAEFVAGNAMPSTVDDILFAYNPPRDFDCLRALYKRVDRCQPFTDYSLKYVRSLVNMCQGHDQDVIMESIHTLC